MSEPIFVKVEAYKDVQNILTLVNDNMGRARKLLQELKDLKLEEDKQLNDFSLQLAEVESKVATINRELSNSPQQ
ncbi:hypothetical protein GOV04_05585 [Candidatus Woesearchaeota archaeon]|nr:hypothetical protein [Candidatus Woesearchaeota archaeon]